MANEGCGYVALTNTIFAQFVGKETEFERIFGFKMYKENGELNFEAMITDFYCATDDSSSSGTTMYDRKDLLETYMKNHGIDVTVRNDLNVTVQNYSQIAQNGEIVVGLYPCILYDETGKKIVNINGGHAMTVTGVTENGMLIVSSWGKKYYIKPGAGEYSRMQFQQIIYN